jgi:uncharacterized protein (TIGR03435 family)
MSRPGSGLSFRAASLFLVPFAVVSLLSSQAQSPPASPVQPAVAMRFEVASIRPHAFAGDEPSDRRMLPGGRFTATATTARTFLRIAFGTDDIRLPVSSGWVDKDLFDINATTVNRAEVTAPEQFQQLILSLLEDRFQLKFHREQKEVPVYWLELEKPGKSGPALQPSPTEAKQNMSVNSNGVKTTMKATRVSMSDLAAALRRQVGRPVEDHTGLAGNFDFQIAWAPESATDSTDPSLFTVLKDQLGLKLQSAKGMADTVVIDQIAQPSAN